MTSMITKDQATNYKILEFHHNVNTGRNGMCQVWQRNGKAQTWLLNKHDFRIPVYNAITSAYQNIMSMTGFGKAGNADQFHAPQDCPRNKEENE